jgi:hypothetical protein
MRLVASWIKANYRPDIAAMADDAFGKPTSVALMTHITKIVMGGKAMSLQAKVQNASMSVIAIFQQLRCLAVRRSRLQHGPGFLRDSTGFPSSRAWPILESTAHILRC